MTRTADFDSSNYILMMFYISLPLIMVIGITGNIMVIVIILKTKELRNSTNVFLFNLAIADLINLVTSGTHCVVDLFSPGTLHSSEVLCKLVPMVGEALIFVSVITVCAIGYERYFVICQPLKAGYICTKVRAIRTCLLAWPIAALFTSPLLSLMVYEQKQNNGTNQGSCRILHDGFWIGPFTIIIMLIFYILPVMILTLIFLTIARHLKRASLAPNVNITVIRHRRQVLAMLATVVICFFLFLLPFRGFTLYVISVPKGSEWRLKHDHNNWLLFGKTMGYVHSAVNPILYNLMSKRFRVGFKRLCCDNGQQRRGRSSTESNRTTSTEMSTLFNEERLTSRPIGLVVRTSDSRPIGTNF